MVLDQIPYCSCVGLETKDMIETYKKDDAEYLHLPHPAVSLVSFVEREVSGSGRDTTKNRLACNNTLLPPHTTGNPNMRWDSQRP